MNKKIIIFAALVFAVVITGFSVSGTYARYVTTLDEQSTDTARVAVWNFKQGDVQGNTTLFGKYYGTNGEILSENDSAVVVSNSQDLPDNVIAPGTKGSYVFGITGSAETNYVIHIKTKQVGGEFSNETVNSGNYKPVKWHLFTGVTAKTGADGTDKQPEGYDTLRDLLSALETEVNTNIVLAANKNYSNYYKITWEWPITTSADNDKYDTQLSEKLSSTETKIGFKYTLSAKQSNKVAGETDTALFSE